MAGISLSSRLLLIPIGFLLVLRMIPSTGYRIRKDRAYLMRPGRVGELFLCSPFREWGREIFITVRMVGRVSPGHKTTA
jgi:hypothetical protein